MYFIIPQLYLSDYEDAKGAPPNCFIVNCTKNLPMLRSGIRLPVNDDLSSDAMETMARELPRVLATIDKVRADNGKVLVHCFAGQQRSAAVVAAYMMSKGMCKQDAIQFVRSKKHDAFLTGVNFDPVLENFSKNNRACLSTSF